MHKYFALTAWMLLAIFGLGLPPQQQVQPVAGVLTLNLVPGTSSFKVILSANVTSVVIANPTPGTIISVIFTENATGGFTVVFGGNIANPCSVTPTANATTTCQFQYDSTSNTWNGIGGGISSVASLPASCSGSTAPVVVVTGGVNYGTFVCDPNGGNVWIPENPNQTISPYAYGAVGHVRFTYNASWSNASSTVSCSNGECNFQCPGGVYPCTSATTGCPSLTCDAGKIVKGAATTPNVQNAATTGTVAVPQGTISTVTNSTTITVSTTTTSACPSGSLTTCTLSWGIQDDTTAINNAAAAAWGNGNRCIALQFPADNFYFSGPIFNGPQGTLKTGNPCSTVNTTNGTGSDITSTGPSLYGAGDGSTVLIPLSAYNFAGCTFGSAANACNGTMPNLQVHDIAINGLGDVVGGTHANVLWETIGSNSGGGCAGGVTVQDISLANWGLTATNSIGFKFGANSCNDAVHKNMNVIMFGAQTCNAVPGGNVFTAYSLFCFGSNGNLFVITPSGSAQLNTFGSMFVCSLGSSNALVTINGGKWVSTGDAIFTFSVCPSQTFGINTVTAAGEIDFIGDQLSLFNGTVTSGVLLRETNTSGIMRFRNTVATATGATNQLFTSGATDKFFDDGGNTFTNGSVANTISGAAIGFTNSANSSVCATGNFALTSGWGTSSVASVAANGTILGCHVTLTGAAGAAGPVLTWTYPAAPIVAPGSCHIVGVSGTLTGVAVGTPGATTVAFTFAGTPSAQTYVFDVGCP